MREQSRARSLMGLTWVAVGFLWMFAGVASEILLPAKDAHSWRMPKFPIAILVMGTLAVVLGFWLLARAKAYRRDTPQTFLTSQEEQQVREAISALENRSSGELQVHLSSAKGDVLESAKKAFQRLGMTQTRERNGVLFFIAVPQRRFAVLGDTAIHEKVSDALWVEVVQAVQKKFEQGQYGAGLCEGIRAAGDALAVHFPRREDDRNELPDLSRG